MSNRRPTTPIRRISRGSISALSSSLQGGSAPGATPLSHLETAMRDIADDVSSLHLNLEQIQGIHEALGVFNENFSMYLYGLKMNAFCVEWPERPTEENFERAAERQAALKAQQDAFQNSLYPQGYGLNLNAGRPSLGGLSDGGGMAGSSSIADQTYMTVEDDSTTAGATPPRAGVSGAAKRGGAAGSGIKRPGAAAGSRVSASSAGTRTAQPLKSALKKPSTTAGGAASAAAAPKKISPALKKKRDDYAHTIIATLPLEWRGSDQKLQKIAETVITTLMANGGKGQRLPEIVAAAKLPQVQVNKCLQALVLAKHVQKTQQGGVIYQLDQSRHGSAP